MDMLKQASVSDLIMRRYPRFINRELRDEYVSSLSADRKLFEDWLSSKRKRRTGDHDGAFAKVRFEERFALEDEALEHLARLSALSQRKDVYLVCQCAPGQRSHREMLLLAAREWFGAPIETPNHAYPVWSRRIRRLSSGPRSSSRCTG